MKTIYARALRGAREDAKLYVVAVSSLTVAFLSLATALLAVSNFAELASRWGHTHRLTIYVQPTAAEAEVARLTQLLVSLPVVTKAEAVSATAARERFLREASSGDRLRGLPAEAFPASIEVEFDKRAKERDIAEVARRLALHRSVVEDVDTYGTWFARIGALLRTGRSLAIGLGVLVMFCVMAIVSNTIRLAVANRREEIEVLKMCGATDSFVRAPFLLEGTLQGLCAALLSLGLLALAYVALRPQIDGALSTFAGIELVFLHPAMAVALVVGGAAVGAIGSLFSVRRYIAV